MASTPHVGHATLDGLLDTQALWWPIAVAGQAPTSVVNAHQCHTIGHLNMHGSGVHVGVLGDVAQGFCRCRHQCFQRVVWDPPIHFELTVHVQSAHRSFCQRRLEGRFGIACDRSSRDEPPLGILGASLSQRWNHHVGQATADGLQGIHPRVVQEATSGPIAATRAFFGGEQFALRAFQPQECICASGRAPQQGIG